MKSQQRIRSKKHNLFTEEANKIGLRAKDDEKVQSIDLIESYKCETSKYLACKKEKIKCNNVRKNTKMINYDDVTKENIKKNNPDWPQISNHPYKMLITGGSGSGKTNALRNLLKKQDADNYRLIEKLFFIY